MANLVDKSGDATSNLVRGGTSTSLSFPMPGNVVLDVESVVATIDNTAGAATTPTLVVRDSSGEVIATKRMDDTFPAGDTGTVTFSLRNTDSGSGAVRMNRENDGRWLSIITSIDSSLPGPPGQGITIEADDANPSSGGFVSLYGGGAFGRVQIGADNTIFMSALGFSWEFDEAGIFECDGLTLNPGTFWQSNIGGGGVSLSCRGPFTVDNSGGTDKIVLVAAAGSSVEVQDRNGNPIFRINEDGSLQGKTGKALTFNL